MDNSEELATLETQHRMKSNKTEQKKQHSTENWKDEQHGPHLKTKGEREGGWTHVLAKGKQFCSVPVKQFYESSLFQSFFCFVGLFYRFICSELCILHTS